MEPTTDELTEETLARLTIERTGVRDEAHQLVERIASVVDALPFLHDEARDRENQAWRVVEHVTSGDPMWWGPLAQSVAQAAIDIRWTHEHPADDPEAS